MDIDRVIQNLREAKKKASCPKGYKYSKKLKSCVPIKKKGKNIGVRGYYMGGGYHRGGDNRSSGNGNGNGKGNGNGHGGNGNGNGGNGGGNGGGGNGGGGGE